MLGSTYNIVGTSNVKESQAYNSGTAIDYTTDAGEAKCLNIL